MLASIANTFEIKRNQNTIYTFLSAFQPLCKPVTDIMPLFPQY